MSSKVNIGIVGLGHLGSLHLKVLSELSDQVTITGICDIQKDRAKGLATQYKIPFVEDYRELIGKIDAVTVCVPTELHLDVGRYFLSHNIHTFIEKPITKTIEQADELIAVAAQHKRLLQVGHVERFNSAFQAVQKFLRDPLFIECHRLNAFPNRSLDIGVVMDLMIHDIDIILGLIRSPIKDVQAVGVNVLTPLEDIASARITFENGCVCNLTASRVSDDVMRKIRIFQRDAYISLDYVKQEAYIYKKHQQNISKEALPIEKEQPLKKELEHFVSCVRDNKTPLISGPEAREALRVALDITRVIWQNNLLKQPATQPNPSSSHA